MPVRMMLQVFVLLLAACSGGPSGGSPEATATPPAAASPPPAQGGTSNVCVEGVTIKDGKVTPERLVVKAPCAVLFTNRDDAIVQIQGQDATPFTLGEMGKDQSWAHTYKDPGQYEYVNTKDPSLRGTVVVQP